MISRRGLLAAVAAPWVLTSRAAARKKNVIFILADDLGAWALNSYGCMTMHTPNLDRLASSGARFTRAYAATPVCSPSRMTFFTGKLPSHHGVQDWLNSNDSGPGSLPYLKGHTTFSQILADNGYTLGLSGKWHMGGDDRAQAGFTDWSTIPGGGGTFKDATFTRNGTRVPTKGFKDDFVGDYAIEFLDRNKEKPFVLFASFFSPHVPYDYQTDRDRQRYADSSFPCFPGAPPHPRHTQKMFGRPFTALNDLNNPKSKLGYSALVTALDYNVGRIVRRLDELGLREDTAVVLTSDHGHCSGHLGVWGKGNSTIPFNMYDTSLHVPLIWSHPASIKPGQVLTPMVSAYDFFPTILDYLGVSAPGDPRRVGRSYAALLRGQNQRWRDELYFEYEYVRAIRTKNLKYIERTKEWPSELYDLEADPGERKNTIGDPKHAGQLKTLRRRLATFFERAGAPPIEQWRSTTSQSLTDYN